MKRIQIWAWFSIKTTSLELRQDLRLKKILIEVFIENREQEFIDLIKNPERFTGYDGESAHKVWRAIYEENCFQPEPWPMTQNELASFNQNYDNVPDSPLSGLCLEKKIFYRVVSGLHR